MSDRTVTRKVLTGTEMDRIIAAAHTSWVSAVVETYLCFGVDITDPDGERIRPADYEIPSDQWSQIAEACSNSPTHRSPLARVNHMLDWMNFGPSGFDR